MTEKEIKNMGLRLEKGQKPEDVYKIQKLPADPNEKSKITLYSEEKNMVTYKIKQGDTLSQIAKDNGTTVDELVKLNNISDPNKIYAGQNLVLRPGDNVSPTKLGDMPGGTERVNLSTNNPYTNKDLSIYDGGFQSSESLKEKESIKNDLYNQWLNYGDIKVDDTLLKDVMDKIQNREKFSYDLNGDALYQQYKDKYIQQGKMAMQDAMGLAAAMTGGYGSSYAASVGNQAYQAHLNNLNDVIPELYQMAYDRYKQEGQDLYNQYGLLSDDYNRKYQEELTKYNMLGDKLAYADSDYWNNHNSEYGKWNDNRTYDTNQYWAETEFGYGQERDKIEDKQWQDSFNEGVRQFNEGQALTREQFEWNKAQAEKAASGSGSGGSGGGSGGGGGNEPEFTYQETDATKNFQSAIKTKNEFYTRGGADKEKYGSYENYIKGVMDRWLSEGKLTENDVATLIAYYGL